MSDNSEFILIDPKFEKPMVNLQEEIEALEKVLRKKREALDKLQANQSPIKPGHIIQWDGTGGRLYRGRVISVRIEWRGFQYRCHRLNNAGKECGYSTVDTEANPTICESQNAVVKVERKGK